MAEKISIYRKIECLVTNSGMPATKGIRPKNDDLGIIRNAALVFSPKRGVLWAGKDLDLPKRFQKPKGISCKGLVAYPGLVDSHTHPAFAGNRAREFSMRMEGATYQDIARMGGGILSTVTATREETLESLTKKIVDRLAVAHKFGVRAMEAKSGYGLSPAAEIGSLRAISAAAKKFGKLKVIKTCMAAHAVPQEFRDDKAEWIDCICNEILPETKQKKLAEFVDIFCDAGYFSIAETKHILGAAKKLGFGIRLHGDELADTGSAALAAEFCASSVDHLLKVSEAGIRALAKSNTIATLLPGTSLFLREPHAPARKLIDAGVAVALATDFNPGTCTTQNLPFIATLGAVQLGMTAPEIIAAITWNPARSLGLEKTFGALLPGFKGEPIFAEGDDPAAIYYKLAAPGLPSPR